MPGTHSGSEQGGGARCSSTMRTTYTCEHKCLLYTHRSPLTGLGWVGHNAGHPPAHIAACKETTVTSSAVAGPLLTYLIILIPQPRGSANGNPRFLTGLG
jgi:hypothetical protein